MMITKDSEIIEQDTSNKTITLFGEIDGHNAEKAIRDIAYIGMKDDRYRKEMEQWGKDNGISMDGLRITPIQLYLNTQGGSCYDGLALYDAIAASKTPVEIVCQGRIMSMGVIVILASNVRRAHKNTTFMIHQVSGFLFGKMKDMAENWEETKRINDILFDIITAKTKISGETLKDLVDHKKDWFMTAQEALELGLITEII